MNITFYYFLSINVDFYLCKNRTKAKIRELPTSTSKKFILK